jgi:hypothetical protein
VSFFPLTAVVEYSRWLWAFFNNPAGRRSKEKKLPENVFASLFSLVFLTRLPNGETQHL